MNSRNIYAEIATDETFGLCMESKLQQLRRMMKIDPLYASKRRIEIIESVQNTIFAATWHASNYGTIMADDGFFTWLDAKLSKDIEIDEITAVKTSSFRQEMRTFLFAYFELLELSKCEQQSKVVQPDKYRALFNDLVDAGIIKGSYENFFALFEKTEPTGKLFFLITPAKKNTRIKGAISKAALVVFMGCCGYDISSPNRSETLHATERYFGIAPPSSVFQNIDNGMKNTSFFEKIFKKHNFCN
jgi:hypothetical protein